jgi:DNA modification methylase
MATNRIICGDCLKVLGTLPAARMIFADPPDNLGMKYNGYRDRLRKNEYRKWLYGVIVTARFHDPGVFWLSHYYTYQQDVWSSIGNGGDSEARMFYWRYTFGQHRHTDCGNGYRPIMRLSPSNVKWNTDAIRVPSARTRAGDKRADPRGRVPDDVWEFPRVCGTFKERRKWAVTQHPEALMERMVKMSCGPGDVVIDMFAHSFTTARVCRRLGIDCISIEISDYYCRKGAKELGVKEIEVMP